MAKKPASDTLYLQRIGARWYARIPVPYGLRKQMGPYFRKALGTTDLQEARHRRWDVLALARAEFERRRSKPGKPAPRSTDYATFRARLAKLGPRTVVNALDGEEIINPALDALADELQEAEEAGRDVATELAALSDHVADRMPISVLLTDYLARNPKANPTTVSNYQGTVSLWISQLGDKPLNGTTRKVATEWLEKVSEGKSRETIKRYVNHMTTLWGWAHRMDEVRPSNPFERLRQDMGTLGKAPESYEALDEAELKKVFGALKGHPDLRSVALISLYSGLRLSECLRAERKQVEGIECYVLSAGKTANAKRIVPVHPELKTIEAPHGASAGVLSVTYGRAVKDLKLPPKKVFHSLRKNFATALERAGCPEAIAVRLLGHRPLSMSYKVYSAGRGAAELQEWVDRVAFKLD